MKNDKVLITGSAGFIGSNYVEYNLKNSEDKILLLDKPTYDGDLRNLEAVSDKITFMEGDIFSAKFIPEPFEIHQFLMVVHFPAESNVDNSISGASDFVHANIVGTFNLLQNN